MKLLVLAQTPPPLHGQSLMVQTLINGLPAHGLALHHVNLALSRDAADIGRWRPGKVFTVLGACLRAIAARFRHGCDTLYYVPAPGKRGALYRDWIVMLLCRPFFKRLVLHWHAAGLGDWLPAHGTLPERWLTGLLLGGARLSIVLNENLRTDAELFLPKEIAVVPNGIADPADAAFGDGRPASAVFQVLFLGLCSEEKGLFAAADAVLAANRSLRAPQAEPKFTLAAAGSFPDCKSASRFRDLCSQHPAALRYAGPVDGEEKSRLLRESRCLCLPSQYPAEGQPLVLLEAMACDLPVIATRWRAIPDTLSPETSRLVAPGDIEAIAAALLEFRQSPPPAQVARKFFLEHFTAGRHLAQLAAALRSL